MLDETRRLYDARIARGGTAAEIAGGSGVNLHWLRKFAQRRFDDPGVVKTEKLLRYLQSTQGGSGA